MPLLDHTAISLIVASIDLAWTTSDVLRRFSKLETPTLNVGCTEQSPESSLPLSYQNEGSTHSIRRPRRVDPFD
jgi:hypothetical protein